MSRADFVEKDPPGMIGTDAVDDNGDIVYYPISEWIEKYGRPGNPTGTDQHGRVLGSFPTEPDFCEREEEDE